MTSGLIVHRSNRVEELVGILADLSAASPLPVFEAEWVVVQSVGMDRWLAMQLAQRQGVAANLNTLFPGKLVACLNRAADPEEATSWSVEELTWALLEILPGLWAKKPLRSLHPFLGERWPKVVGRRAWLLAHTIADQLEQYGRHRADMVEEWSAGGHSGTHKDDWQPLVWRELEGSLGRSLVADHQALIACLEDDSRALDLPARLFVFGASALPGFLLEILAALARRIPVHLLVPMGSKRAWEQVESCRGVLEHQEKPWKRRELAPLLSLRGAGASTLEEGCTEVSRAFHAQLLVQPGVEEGEERLAIPEPDSLLHRLQGELAGQASGPGTDGEDSSIQVHSCYGSLRQVQALKQALLGCLDEDPSLEARDIIVLCPDIAHFAPLIEAEFLTDGGGTPAIPFSIADRSVVEENPMVQGLLAVFDLATRRRTLPQVLDVLGLEAVRRRFGLQEEGVQSFARVVQEAGVRWGRDAKDRERADQPGVEENTWEWGLDRLLLGHAIRLEDGADAVVGGLLPWDELEGRQAEELGRAIHAVRAILDGVARLDTVREPQAWKQELLSLGALFAEDPHQPWQRSQLEEAIGTLDRAGPLMDAAAVAAVLEPSLAIAGSSRGLMTGLATFCGMVPLRSIPHRVVALLGMDGQAFPRVDKPSALDIGAREPRLGDRSRRGDDRLQFLEAVLAARDRLIITYAGHDIATNSELPPSTVVEELLEACAPLGTCQRIAHPLQAFSPRNFSKEQALSYDQALLDGIQAARGKQSGDYLLLTGKPLSMPLPSQISLDDLAWFWRSPVEGFLRSLGIWRSTDGDAPPEREPVELRGLDHYLLRAEGLGALRRGEGVEEALRRRGVLPVGALGTREARLVEESVGSLMEVLGAWESKLGDPTSYGLELSVDLGPQKLPLLGSVDARKGGRIFAHLGGLGPRHVLPQWLRHLAAGVAGMEGPTVLLGVTKGRVEQLVLAPVAEPAPLLEDLAKLYLRGQTLPLPFFPRTSSAWFENSLEGDEDKAGKEAAKAWAPGSGRSGEREHLGLAPWVSEALPWEEDSELYQEGELSFQDLSARVLAALVEHREERA